MNILLTGAAGFIGSFTARELVNAEHTVVGIDNFDPFYDRVSKEFNLDLTRQLSGDQFGTSNPKEVKLILDRLNSYNPLNGKGNFEFEEVDVRDFEKLEQLFKKYKFDAVIHLAAMAGVPFSINNPRKYTEVNIDGTVNLLELSVKNSVSKFIFASSSSTYGNLETFPFKETADTNHPISPYAATKRMGEIICYTYHYLYKLDVACLKFFTVYGPLQRPYGMAIQKFIKQASNDEPITVYGDGSMARDYTYIDDITAGILGAMAKNSGYNIYNLGNEKPVTVKDLAAKVIDRIGKGIIEYLPLPSTEVNKTFADITKAKQTFGYNPKTTIDTGLDRQIEVFNLMPEWYKEMEGLKK